MHRDEQEQARKRLRNIGLVAEKRTGIPCRLYYKVEFAELAVAISAVCEPQKSVPKAVPTGLPFSTGALQV
jgi:hypothetical protein